MSKIPLNNPLLTRGGKALKYRTMQQKTVRLQRKYEAVKDSLNKLIDERDRDLEAARDEVKLEVVRAEAEAMALHRYNEALRNLLDNVTLSAQPIENGFSLVNSSLIQEIIEFTGGESDV